MESIEIQNFLTIRQARLEVRPFTILIGPQASGKSIVAKLLFYFRDFLAKQYILSILNQETKEQLELRAIASFGQIFPKYAWSDQKFQIKYRIDDTTILISHQGRSTKKSGIKFDYSQNLVELHRKAKDRHKRKLEESKATGGHLERELESFGEVLREYILETPIGHHFHHSIFIPASRSFFANLQKNVFSLLALSIDVDSLTKEFGAVYEESKPIYDCPIISEDRICLRHYEEMKQEIEEMLAGQYVYEDGQDWIVSGKRKINLAHASSGQQEALPLLVVLLARFQYGTRGGSLRTVFY